MSVNVMSQFIGGLKSGLGLNVRDIRFALNATPNQSKLGILLQRYIAPVAVQAINSVESQHNFANRVNILSTGDGLIVEISGRIGDATKKKIRDTFVKAQKISGFVQVRGDADPQKVAFAFDRYHCAAADLVVGYAEIENLSKTITSTSSAIDRLTWTDAFKRRDMQKALQTAKESRGYLDEHIRDLETNQIKLTVEIGSAVHHVARFLMQNVNWLNQSNRVLREGRAPATRSRVVQATADGKPTIRRGGDVFIHSEPASTFRM